MEEHERSKYQFTCRFIETNTFKNNYGKISESERERLYFDLMLGRGELIKDTGGLKEIRCGIGGADGKKGWEVVFADYNFPEIKKRLYILLIKFPIGSVIKLVQEEKRKLRMIKEKLDEYVDRFYWETYG